MQLCIRTQKAYRRRVAESMWVRILYVTLPNPQASVLGQDVYWFLDIHAAISETSIALCCLFV